MTASHSSSLSPTLDRVAVASSPTSATAGERRVCGLLAFLAFALLGVSAWLKPAVSGVGTHQSLGLPPCGWMVAYGMPCPTCGMTTAFSHAAHGSLLESARVQPMGFLLAVGTAATGLVCLHVALTGSRLAHVLGARFTPRVFLAFGVIALLSWGWKIALVRGLLNGTIGQI